MANLNETLNGLLSVDGAMAVALVDSNSGMMLGSAGSGVDLEIAAAGNTEVVRAKLKTMKGLGLGAEKIEDILITLGKQYHIIRPIESKVGLFIYLVLDRSKANLAMARRACLDAEQGLTL
jgi:predicted regulator of Ras-like GTPase activity (Roadblock/LC7/MglB family)